MGFYRSLTLLHTDVPSDQTNFPVVLVGTFSYLKTVANGGKVTNASGFDIYFSSDIAGSSVLNFERVSWDGATGKIQFWIQVPTLSSSSDTTIYLQYGGGGSSDLSNAPATWDTNYVAVYHFGSDSSLSVSDSKNVNNGTNHGVTASTGPFGTPQGAGEFVSASSTYVDLGADTSLAITGHITLEAFYFGNGSGSGFQRMISNLTDSSNFNGYELDANYGSGNAFFLTANSGTLVTPFWAYSLAAAWAYLVGVYDGTNAIIFQDGVSRQSSASAAPGSSAQHTRLGSWPATPAGVYLDGQLAEVRISKTNRSADYITTNWNQFNDYANFLTIGAEQTNATPINESIIDTLSLSDAENFTLGLQVVVSDTNASNWGDAVLFTLSIPGILLIDDFSGTWLDHVDLLMPFDIGLSDSLALTDGLNQPAKNMNAFIDSLALSDSQSLLVSITLSFSDTFTWSDSTSIVSSLLVIESDTFTWTDLFGFSIPFNKSVTDFFIWRDGVTAQWSSVLPPLTDTFSFSDSVTVSNVPFWIPVNEVIADSLSLSDRFLYNLAINIGVSDVFSPSDSVVVADTFNPFNQSFSDQFHFSDSLLLSVSGRQLQFADQLNLSDSVLVQNATAFNSYIRRYLNDEPV